MLATTVGNDVKNAPFTILFRKAKVTSGGRLPEKGQMAAIVTVFNVVARSNELIGAGPQADALVNEFTSSSSPSRGSNEPRAFAAGDLFMNSAFRRLAGIDGMMSDADASQLSRYFVGYAIGQALVLRAEPQNPESFYIRVERPQLHRAMKLGRIPDGNVYHIAEYKGVDTKAHAREYQDGRIVPLSKEEVDAFSLTWYLEGLYQGVSILDLAASRRASRTAGRGIVRRPGRVKAAADPESPSPLDTPQETEGPKRMKSSELAPESPEAGKHVQRARPKQLPPKVAAPRPVV